ncbi:MAG: Mov34/MPN/PAD-1 family protein [Armatimonadetes bacterium]|nr:Mov34/MPN/PAD-1 family protein [Armatimonadota bacterium]
MDSTDSPSEDDLVLGPSDEAEELVDWDPWHDAAVQVATLGADKGGSSVAVAADALFDMIGHGSDQTDREVGGVLLGDFAQTPRGPLTRVTDIIIADSNEASLTHVTFTHDAWERIHADLDQRGDSLRIVGWYHTHPGFGPFLSAHDRFIQEHFFAHPRHAALVLDPVQDLVAVFAWRDGVIERLPGCLVYDDAERSEELQQLLAKLTYAGDERKKHSGLLSWVRW